MSLRWVCFGGGEGVRFQVVYEKSFEMKDVI